MRKSFFSIKAGQERGVYKLKRKYKYSVLQLNGKEENEIKLRPRYFCAVLTNISSEQCRSGESHVKFKTEERQNNNIRNVYIRDTRSLWYTNLFWKFENYTTHPSDRIIFVQRDGYCYQLTSIPECTIDDANNDSHFRGRRWFRSLF